MLKSERSIFHILFAILAFTMAVFQIYSSLYRPLSDITLQNVHIAFAYTLIFLGSMIDAEGKKFSTLRRVIYGLAIVVSLVCISYMLINQRTLIANIGRQDQSAYVIGALLAIVTLYATYKSFGPAIPILTMIIISYMVWGRYLDSPIFFHGGFSARRIISTLNISFGGMYGTLLNVAATFLALFMIFGGLLGKSGASEFFMKLAMAIGGRTKAGPALAAVIGSALVGSINGSAVANVATTGPFTIRMMKDRGYKPHFAAAVEAVASTGGMFLPPIMGVGAFIMADITGISYARIIFYALVPALLYFLVCTVVVILQSEKLNLSVVSNEDIPPLGKTFREGFFYLFPIIAIIWALVVGYSITRAGLFGIFVLLAIIVIKIFVVNRNDIWNIFRYATWKPLVEGSVDGIRSLIGVSATMACIGMMVDCLINTGLTNRLLAVIVQFGAQQQLMSLLLITIVALVIGAGIPTTATYILLATMAAPPLVEIGFSLISVHLFLYYFALIGSITPPVGNAAIVAAKIGEADYYKTCFVSMKMAAAAFILPFIFIYRNELLMIGYFMDCLDAIVTCAIGLVLLCCFFERFMFIRCTIWEQIALLIASIMLIFPFPLFISGIALMVAIIIAVRQFKARQLLRNLQLSDQIRAS